MRQRQSDVEVGERVEFGVGNIHRLSECGNARNVPTAISYRVCDGATGLAVLGGDNGAVGRDAAIRLACVHADLVLCVGWQPGGFELIPEEHKLSAGDVAVRRALREIYLRRNLALEVTAAIAAIVDQGRAAERQAAVRRTRYESRVLIE